MCNRCDRDTAVHSVDSADRFPTYQAVTFMLCAVLFTWCAQGACDLDTAAGNTRTMADMPDHQAAAREAAAAEIKRVCRGGPLAIKVCAEDIRARHAK